MNKFFSLLAAVALACTFNACDDVPAPYEVNDDPSDNPGTSTDILLEETFSQSLGTFKSVNTTGSFNWAVSYGSAQITGYADNTNYDACAYLVSPKIDLTDVEAAHMSFTYILRYALASTMKANHQLLVCDDYDGTNIEAASWEALDFNLVQGSDWNTWYESGNINIPQKYMGKQINVALRYISTSAKAGTWEVKNLCVKKGEGDYAGEEQPSDEVRTLPYTEAFSSTMGGFVNYTTSGGGTWEIDFSTLKGTGYNSATKETVAGTFYAVSPEISLAGQTEAHVAYEYILRYNKGDENQQLLITDNFDAANPAQGWTVLNRSHTEGTDWVNFEKADIDIPAAYMGKNIRLAFRYNTDNVSGSTIEIRNFSIEAGKAGNTDPDPVTPPADADELNGGFEFWTGSTPNNWTTASTAGNATLSQSTDAHSGNLSVKVGGSDAANKRIGYKEITLPAGDYTLKFYAKAATATGGSVRPGYVPVDDSNKVGSYVYGSYSNGLTATEWTLVEHTFTLDAATRVSIVIMNSKNPGGDVLIDDVTLQSGSTFYIK